MSPDEYGKPQWRIGVERRSMHNSQFGSVQPPVSFSGSETLKPADIPSRAARKRRSAYPGSETGMPKERITYHPASIRDGEYDILEQTPDSIAVMLVRGSVYCTDVYYLPADIAGELAPGRTGRIHAGRIRTALDRRLRAAPDKSTVVK